MNSDENERFSASNETAKANVSAETDEKDWNTENAEFVATYNKIIDIEGVALEEYRAF